MPTTLTDTTVFLVTTGEPTEAAARAALEAQTARCKVEVVDRVAPMDRAFQAMIDRCRTRYYVQVDADMVLRPSAVEYLHDAIAGQGEPLPLHTLNALSKLDKRALSIRERVAIVRWVSPHPVAMICAPLWDDFDDRPIFGVKIYDHDVFRLLPYAADSLSCEVEQLARLKAMQRTYAVLPLAERDACFGRHGTAYTPAQAFSRYRGLARKQRRSVDRSPPWGELAWVESLHGKHLAEWRKTGAPERLAAALGLAAGLTGELPPEREADYRAEDDDWKRIEERYFAPRELPKWVTDWRACTW